MLDKKSANLLKIINEKCADAGYKVISKAELLELMNKEDSTAPSVLTESLNILSKNEYVSIKYEDEQEVCLCPLSKGRVFIEDSYENTASADKTRKKYMACCFLGGAVGSVIGCAICFIIAHILGG